MEIFLGIIYVFHQILGGNLDLFYLVAIFFMVFNIIKRKNNDLLKSIFIFSPIIVIYFLQVTFLENFIYSKGLIFIMKIFICIYLYQYTKTNFHKFNKSKFIYTITIIIGLLFFISLIYKNKVFWLLNDVINKFSTTRLKLLYIEPSELSFHIAILVILLIFSKNNIKQFLSNKIDLFVTIFLLMIMMLSKGLGGIAILGFAIFSVLFAIYIFKMNIIGKIKFFYLVLFLIPIILIIFKNSFEPIIQRVMSIINGTDSSFNYRYFTGSRIMKASIDNNPILGIGFGALNTEYYNYIFSSLGMVGKLANSFMYIIVEGGILISFYITVFYGKIISGIKYDKKFKYTLLIFIITYQIAGSYITNPVNWIVCGIIANNFNYGGLKHENK